MLIGLKSIIIYRLPFLLQICFIFWLVIPENLFNISDTGIAVHLNDIGAEEDASQVNLNQKGINLVL